MSIVVRFTPLSLTAEQYDESVRRLTDSGDFPPDGMDYHVCFGTEGNLRVSEIYDSRERQWRHLDLGGMKWHLRYRLRRVRCPRCGVAAFMWMTLRWSCGPSEAAGPSESSSTGRSPRPSKPPGCGSRRCRRRASPLPGT